MRSDKYEVHGHELVEKTAKPHGNGARVLVPKDWIGDQVKVIRVSKNQNNHNPRIAPVAALMYDAIADSENPSLQTAMRKIVRFQSFNDVDDSIVEDFNYALDAPDTYEGLKHRLHSVDDKQKTEFYTDLLEKGRASASLSATLRDWI